jgi:hypothetical protein
VQLTHTGALSVFLTNATPTTFRIAETASAAPIDFTLVSDVNTGVTDTYITFFYKAA